MSYMLDWAEEELRYAGYNINDTEDGPNKWLAEGTLELLKVFVEQGHSGASAPYAVALFEKLAMWKPIKPLTGEEEEWRKPSGKDSHYQNKRDSSVFKGIDGQAYWTEGRIFWEWFTHPDIDEGKPYKSYCTSRDSRVNITFPWTRPDKPEYIFMPTKEFPTEELS
jgi:hypothetical protein